MPLSLSNRRPASTKIVSWVRTCFQGCERFISSTRSAAALSPVLANRRVEKLSRLLGTAASIESVRTVSERDEHTSFGAVLLRGQAWRHQRGGAQYSLRHSTAGHERTDHSVGGLPRGDSVPEAALRPYTGGR